jgi:Rps23 Pro-64 3,4-dihydroxylase Tpa1-like proline 4-hydroxylase
VIKTPVNPKYSNPEKLNKSYTTNKPFSHIVLDNFIDEKLLQGILEEFPDLSKLKSGIKHNNSREIKFASRGFSDISPKASELISYLNSDLFLTYLQKLTGINEILISDPYLSGGGYHELKNGGVLKVHADFNKHPYIDLDRRINLLLYLNPGWKKEWGGNLELYYENDLNSPCVSVTPEFNRCVIFSTTSFTYHGNPEPIECPSGVSRKSIALYYFSLGRPKSEFSSNHSTLFVETKGEKYKKHFTIKTLVIDLLPPILFRYIQKLLRK